MLPEQRRRASICRYVLYLFSPLHGIKHFSAEIQNLHRDLSDFIFPKYSYGRQRKYENLRISLGPSPGSFWATDGIESRWNNIPAQLEDALRRHKPRVVTLGVGDNFILLAQDGDWAYHLPNYRALDELLGNYILAKGGLDWISVSALTHTCTLLLACLAVLLLTY